MALLRKESVKFFDIAQSDQVDWYSGLTSVWTSLFYQAHPTALRISPAKTNQSLERDLSQ